MPECDCIFCEKCPHCNHRADEHMCGDFDAGICYKCQAEGKECHDFICVSAFGGSMRDAKNSTERV